MKEKKYINIHPGEILLQEFMKPLNITNYRMAKGIGVQQIQISRLSKGKMAISSKMALRIGKFFGTSAEFWMNMQISYELRKLRNENSELFEEIKEYQKTV